MKPCVQVAVRVGRNMFVAPAQVDRERDSGSDGRKMSGRERE